jgi:hypothetical protein
MIGSDEKITIRRLCGTYAINPRMFPRPSKTPIAKKNLKGGILFHNLTKRLVDAEALVLLLFSREFRG